MLVNTESLKKNITDLIEIQKAFNPAVKTPVLPSSMEDIKDIADLDGNVNFELGLKSLELLIRKFIIPHLGADRKNVETKLKNYTDFLIGTDNGTNFTESAFLKNLNDLMNFDFKDFLTKIESLDRENKTKIDLLTQNLKNLLKSKILSLIDLDMSECSKLASEDAKKEHIKTKLLAVNLVVDEKTLSNEKLSCFSSKVNSIYDFFLGTSVDVSSFLDSVLTNYIQITDAAKNSPAPTTPTTSGTSNLTKVLCGLFVLILVLGSNYATFFFTRKRAMINSSISNSSIANAVSNFASPIPVVTYS